VRAGLTFLLLVACVSAGSAAAPPAAAPLPAGWTSDNDDETDDGYAPPPSPRGVYVHGFAGGGVGFDPRDGAPCKGDEAAQGKVSAAIAQGDIEFWFYATAAQGVLFERSAGVDPAKPCAEALTFDYQVSRAYVADGIVHSFDVNDGGDLEPAWTKPLGYSAGVYSGAFTLIHNLMARREGPGKGRISHKRVAGIPVTCAGISGLVWSNLCIADWPREIKGMILSADAGDDERQMFALDAERVATGVALDGRLFEAGRRWRGVDGARVGRGPGK
jgi:hypothetical protein